MMIARYGTTRTATRNQTGVTLKLKIVPVSTNMILILKRWICDTRANWSRLNPVSVLVTFCTSAKLVRGEIGKPDRALWQIPHFCVRKGSIFVPLAIVAMSGFLFE